MSAWSMPQIFFSEWFWVVILAGLVGALCRARKECLPPFPKTREFLVRHRKGIGKATDTLLTVMIMLGFLFLLHPVHTILDALSTPQPIRAASLRFAVAYSSAFMIWWSSGEGLLVGCLSFFESNVTTWKRTILLVLCLLPMVFAVLALAIDANLVEHPWPMIQLSVCLSMFNWIVNVPPVVTGRTLSDITRRIMAKLHLKSDDQPN